jgi:hypothetical protein
VQANEGSVERDTEMGVDLKLSSGQRQYGGDSTGSVSGGGGNSARSLPQHHRGVFRCPFAEPGRWAQLKYDEEGRFSWES